MPAAPPSADAAISLLQRAENARSVGHEPEPELEPVLAPAIAPDTAPIAPDLPPSANIASRLHTVIPLLSCNFSSNVLLLLTRHHRCLTLGLQIRHVLLLHHLRLGSLLSMLDGGHVGLLHGVVLSLDGGTRLVGSSCNPWGKGERGGGIGDGLRDGRWRDGCCGEVWMGHCLVGIVTPVRLELQKAFKQ